MDLVTAERRVLVLAIDAANPGLLRQWADDGTLPHLKGLFQSGLHAETRSVEGLFIGATWPSFYTGVNPARHGFFWLSQLRTGTYELWRAGPADLARCPTIWEHLSTAGRRVAVLDVPLTRLSPGINGIQTVEWGVHDPVFGLQASPRRLKREILDRFGRHPAPPNCNAAYRTLAEYETFADQLCRGAAVRAGLTRHLLEARNHDFAIQVFSESHCAGHQLWHSHDPAHPAFQAYRASGGEDLIRRVYVAIDSAVGQILAGTDPEVIVALIVLHGMSFTCGASTLLAEMLERLGIATAAPPPPPAPPPGPLARFRNQAAALYRELPEAFRRPLYEFRQSTRKRLVGERQSIPIDPRRSRAFALDLGFASSGIRLNLVGREPQGQVEPGRDAEALCHDLTAALLDFRDPDSGRPVISSIRRSAGLFDGPFLGNLPDLIVEWDLDHPLGTTATGEATGAAARAHSARTGLIERTNDYCRTGEHRNEGLVIFRGPGIPRGALDRPISNLDLAPTITALLGHPMTDTDGEAVPEVVQAR